MIKQVIIGEFKLEAESTRKLLNAIPDDVLTYRPQPNLWSIAELASHIAETYNWYEGTFNQDEFDMATYKYDKGDISKTAHIVAKFEENVAKATQVLNGFQEMSLMNQWTMKMGDKILMPSMPKYNVIRGFLFNHLYHHRGQLVSLLRVKGCKVPVMYGNTADSK